MKTLKKDGTFKRVPDSNEVDIDKIRNLLKEGWNYCSKSDWRESNKKESNKESKKKKKSNKE
jgi:hypothetical protein